MPDLTKKQQQKRDISVKPKAQVSKKKDQKKYYDLKLLSSGTYGI
jgi:hypothetical protein